MGPQRGSSTTAVATPSLFKPPPAVSFSLEGLAVHPTSAVPTHFTRRSARQAGLSMDTEPGIIYLNRHSLPSTPNSTHALPSSPGYGRHGAPAGDTPTHHTSLLQKGTQPGSTSFPGLADHTATPPEAGAESPTADAQVDSLHTRRKRITKAARTLPHASGNKPPAVEIPQVPEDAATALTPGTQTRKRRGLRHAGDVDSKPISHIVEDVLALSPIRPPSTRTRKRPAHFADEPDDTPASGAAGRTSKTLDGTQATAPKPHGPRGTRSGGGGPTHAASKVMSRRTAEAVGAVELGDDEAPENNEPEAEAQGAASLRRGSRVRRKRTLDMDEEVLADGDRPNRSAGGRQRGSGRDVEEGSPERESGQSRRKRAATSDAVEALMGLVGQQVSRCGGKASSALGPRGVPSGSAVVGTNSRAMSTTGSQHVPSLWAPPSYRPAAATPATSSGKTSSSSRGEASHAPAGPRLASTPGLPAFMQQEEHLKQVLAEVAGRFGTSRSACSSSPCPSPLQTLLATGNLVSPTGPQTPSKPLLTRTSIPMPTNDDAAAHPGPIPSPQLHLSAKQGAGDVGSEHQQAIMITSLQLPADLGSQTLIQGSQRLFVAPLPEHPPAPPAAAATTSSCAAAESANASAADGVSHYVEDQGAPTISASPVGTPGQPTAVPADKALALSSTQEDLGAHSIPASPVGTPGPPTSVPAEKAHTHSSPHAKHANSEAERAAGAAQGPCNAEVRSTVWQAQPAHASTPKQCNGMEEASTHVQAPTSNLALLFSQVPQPSSQSLPADVTPGKKSVMPSGLDTRSPVQQGSERGALVPLQLPGSAITIKTEGGGPHEGCAMMMEGPRTTGRRGGGRGSRVKAEEGLEGACQHPHCKLAVWSQEASKPYCFTHMKERGLCEVVGCRKWSRSTPDEAHLYCNQHMELAPGGTALRPHVGKGTPSKGISGRAHPSPRLRASPSLSPSTTLSVATTPTRSFARHQPPPNPLTPQPLTASTPGGISSAVTPIKQEDDCVVYAPSHSAAHRPMPPAALFSSPPKQLAFDEPRSIPTAPRKRARTKPRNAAVVRRLPSLFEDPVPASPACVQTAETPNQHRQLEARNHAMPATPDSKHTAHTAAPIRTPTQHRISSPLRTPFAAVMGSLTDVPPAAATSGPVMQPRYFESQPNIPSRGTIGDMRHHGESALHQGGMEAVTQATPERGPAAPRRTRGKATTRRRSLPNPASPPGHEEEDVHRTNSEMVGGTLSVAGSSLGDEDAPQLLLQLAAVAAAAQLQEESEEAQGGARHTADKADEVSTGAATDRDGQAARRHQPEAGPSTAHLASTLSGNEAVCNSDGGKRTTVVNVVSEHDEGTAGGLQTLASVNLYGQGIKPHSVSGAQEKKIVSSASKDLFDLAAAAAAARQLTSTAPPKWLPR